MTTPDHVDIVFEEIEPPEGQSGPCLVFIEAENPDQESISIGDWVERDDGYHALRINLASLGEDGLEMETVAEFLRSVPLAYNPEVHRCNDALDFPESPLVCGRDKGHEGVHARLGRHPESGAMGLVVWSENETDVVPLGVLGRHGLDRFSVSAETRRSFGSE